MKELDEWDAIPDASNAATDTGAVDEVINTELAEVTGGKKTIKNLRFCKSCATCWYARPVDSVIILCAIQNPTYKLVWQNKIDKKFEGRRDMIEHLLKVDFLEVHGSMICDHWKEANERRFIRIRQKLTKPKLQKPSMYKEKPNDN